MCLPLEILLQALVAAWSNTCRNDERICEIYNYNATELQIEKANPNLEII
jgi:hypothetical protein